MARKNRVSVYDGVYHVTTRIANRAMLLKPEEVKRKLQEIILGVVAFSGVELWAFAIMDNHLHLVLHVPPVPKEHWLDPSDEPVAYAFGMRPPECRVPLWSPEGDCPLPKRPSLGFMLSDDEMVDRLSCLYGPKRAEGIAKEWAAMRERGCDAFVDEAKERYCRRMYNLSQCLKTIKETVSRWYNETYGHEGCLWQGRFYSGVVERSHEVFAVVAAYVAYNPVKAKIAASPADWEWSSYSLAVNDQTVQGDHCRLMYERMFGRPWQEVRATLESVFADGLPEGITPEQIKEWFDDYDEDACDANGNPTCPPPIYRASQVIRVTLKAFTRGAYIGRDFEFLKRVRALLPDRFPSAGRRSVKRCRAFIWELPDTALPMAA